MGKSAGREKDCPPMNWWATSTKPAKAGCFQSASADFVKVAQHFNAGQGCWEGEAPAEPKILAFEVRASLEQDGFAL